MSTITLPNTFANNSLADATEVNSNFSTIVNDYNGSISNANISGAAGIEESKILFSTSGHGHGGGSDGQQIQLQTDVRTISRDVSTASSTQEITGLNFNPQAFILLMANDSGGDDAFSVGISNVTDDHSLHSPPAGGSTSNYEVNPSDTRSIFFETSSGNRYVGQISSTGSDGYTITWTKTGSPTGTIRVAIMALAVTSG